MASGLRSPSRSFDDSVIRTRSNNFVQPAFQRRSLARSSSLPRRPVLEDWEKGRSTTMGGQGKRNNFVADKRNLTNYLPNGYVNMNYKGGDDLRKGQPRLKPMASPNARESQRVLPPSGKGVTAGQVYPVLKKDAHVYPLPPTYPTYKRQGIGRSATRTANGTTINGTLSSSFQAQEAKLNKNQDRPGQLAISAAAANPRLVSRLGMFGQISEINDHVYLSGVQPLRPDKIRQKKISSIVNATIDEPSIYVPGIDCLKVRIDDSPYAHLDAYFDLVADRVKAEKEAGGKVLVHCVAGVSRSASLVLAYLMKHERLPLREAYWRVKAVRPIIRPNIGFWRQLIKYEQKLFGKNTVRFVASKWGDEVPDVYTEELKGYSASPPSSSPGTEKTGEGKADRARVTNNLRAPERIIPIAVEVHHFRSTGRSPSRFHTGTPLPSLQSA